MDEVSQEVTVAKLLRGLRLAAVLVTAVTLFGLALPTMLTDVSVYDGLPQQVVAFVMLAVVVMVAGVCSWRDCRIGWARWPLLASVLGASVLAVTGVPAWYVLSDAEWSYGVIGWCGLVLLLGQRGVEALSFLGLHTCLSFAHLIVLGLAPFGWMITSALVLGYQVPFVVAAMVLRRLAAAAARAAREQEQLRTAEAVAEHLHEDRQARYADLAVTTVPLLAHLAVGGADIGDDRVRGAYLVEAARMRRLFAECDEAPEPLLHELRACADLAERQGVAVSVDTCGDYPTPPKPIRRELIDPTLRIMVTAATQARVVLRGSPELVTVSVVADGAPPALATLTMTGEGDAVAVTNMVDGDRIWVEATWRPQR